MFRYGLRILNVSTADFAAELTNLQFLITKKQVLTFVFERCLGKLSEKDIVTTLIHLPTFL